MRRHENLHDIVGAGRFGPRVGAQMQFDKGAESRELTQFQSAFAYSRVVFQGLQGRKARHVGRGARTLCEPKVRRRVAQLSILQSREARLYELPFVIQFEGPGLLEGRHRGHQRFAQESRERRGTVFFGRASCDWLV